MAEEWDSSDHWEESEGEASDEDASSFGTCFIDYLLELFYGGAVSAKSVCVLCYFAWKAGASGTLLAHLAYRPDADSGHYHRHLDRKLNSELKNMKAHKLLIPMHKRASIGRQICPTPVLAAHTELDDEMRNDVGFDADLEAAVAERALPATYFEHPVVRNAPPGTRVAPVGLFVDGVPFQKQDGAVGFFVYSLITGVRHLIVSLKKSHLCKCGCRAWCSMWTVMDWLRYSIDHMAVGTYPTEV